jgi:CheY-like chemotaxis protein
VKVLVVEDSPTTQAFLRVLLEDLGHEVSYASDAHGCLTQLRTATPDTVLLDYRLPDADGRAVLQTMRRQHRWAGIPVLVLTAAPEADTEGLEVYAPVAILRKAVAADKIAGALAELTKGG